MSGMENMNKPPSRSSRPSAEELAKWNTILANEGLSDEAEQEVTDHTPAYEHAVTEAYMYYLTTDRHDWGAHRAKLQELVSEMKVGGANQEELEQFSDEDSMRAIEDRAASLLVSARQIAQEIIQKRSMFASRPEALAKLIQVKLLEDAPEIPQETLNAFALNAAESFIH